jgi:hypothetical protein
MKKNWLNFAAFLMMGTILFSACNKETILTAPPDIIIDLGQALDEREGIVVEGGKESKVLVTWAPEFNNEIVDHYIATYSLEDVIADRNVYVSSGLLAGQYSVVDTPENYPVENYNMTVTKSTQEYNKLLISNFLGFTNLQVVAVVEGTIVKVVKYTPQGWATGESIEATGTYDGKTKKLLNLTYEIIEIVKDKTLITKGSAALTKL